MLLLGLNQQKRETQIHHAEAIASLIFNSMYITAKVVCHVATNKDKGSHFRQKKKVMKKMMLLTRGINMNQMIRSVSVNINKAGCYLKVFH